MFLVTYTLTYEEANAIEACKTSRDMLNVTYTTPSRRPCLVQQQGRRRGVFEEMGRWRREREKLLAVRRGC